MSLQRAIFIFVVKDETIANNNVRGNSFPVRSLSLIIASAHWGIKGLTGLRGNISLNRKGTIKRIRDLSTR